MKGYTLFLVHLFICVFFLLPLEAQAQQIYKKHNGIIVVKKDSLLRALSAFTGLPEGGTWYANAVNAYQEAMGNNIQVYSMIIPISSAFYWPENYYQVTNNSQRATLDTMFANMNKKVKKIDVWEIMKQHKDEAIYARTDHHWLPLAAYYAAQMFANVAKVPFRNLMAYDENIIRRFVGSMVNFSGDAMLKSSPEDFIYYTPKDCPITTTYVEHILKNRRVVGVKPETEGNFYWSYGDGNSNAYCTFMGGDIRTTHISTPTKNRRRLLIIKDSFGNAIPGYLFFSFEDIYVVDFRYFQENIKDYAIDKQITDLLIVNNVQHAYTQGTAKSLMDMLNRPRKK